MAISAVEAPERLRAAAERFRIVREFTEKLCAPLAPEDCVPQSMVEASPVKWQIAHVTWFFEQFLLPELVPGFRSFHPAFATLFNSYYNAVGKRVARGTRGMLTRPTLEEVFRYRKRVEESVLEAIAAFRGPAPERILEILELGIHHEQQHQELILTDLKHLLSQNPLRPVYSSEAAGEERGVVAPSNWEVFPGGQVRIGFEGDGFHFDNEGPAHRRFLEPFALASRLVTNEEFLAFMADGGYERSELWLDDGWTEVNRREWRSPLYWEAVDGAWQVFTLGGLRPLAAGEPVAHVSFYEADAFARWSGARLPLEDEWESACRDLPLEGNFVDSGRFHPAAAKPSPARLLQAFGDLWEWTQSPYTPYPGYQPVPGALGEYNGKFMCNQIVLRGGSCATSRSHIRPTYRNFFYPDARWQFSGIRLARSVQ